MISGALAVLFAFVTLLPWMHMAAHACGPGACDAAAPLDVASAGPVLSAAAAGQDCEICRGIAASANTVEPAGTALFVSSGPILDDMSPFAPEAPALRARLPFSAQAPPRV